MLKKGSKLNSILTGSCPKCQEESMYLEKNPFKMGKIFEMHENCSHCGTRYKMEPSFFYGAMYVSYGLSIAFAVAAFIISNVFLGLGLIHSFIAIIFTLVVLFPVILRLSRNIWINMFVHFDRNWKEHKH
ncbi:DUF983 domain-containing protein [Flavobacterium lacus]|jgi:uncharacterized protein (DUF983 family)|uniref:Uncharacterized protein DUF983 n=1 Tax=Flavobacterium lacus TaxID=1353778 RepID=A0A328WVK2_9FLAO|nr:DUF983 domain-containing protein [Flavobacterium lacus]RAR47884.1 uncharacterized protein DUF983 [Flavobacterium lacus]